MGLTLILSEGKSAGGFEPLELTRPCFMIRDGALTNAERWIELLQPTQVRFNVREHLRQMVSDTTGWIDDNSNAGAPTGDIWTVEGMTQPTADRRWGKLEFDNAFTWEDGECRVTRVQGGNRSRPIRDFPARRVEGMWNLIEHLSEQLAFDFGLWKRAHKNSARNPHAPSRGVFVVGDAKLVHVGRNVRIDPQNVIDTTGGPVILGDGVRLEPFNRIDGPAFIGRGTTLLGGKFTAGTAIGPGCKIGGEWEASIAQGFVNKAHAGFWGHGILGEWVNLGALTTNSDLKNNYGTVRVMRGDVEVETGQIKVGAFLADHTKTGIGTLIPTGATWGVGVNYFGGRLAPKDIPSFVWAGQDGATEHRLEPMIKTANTGLSRRADILKKLGRADHLSDAEAQLLKTVFEKSAAERARFLNRRSSS